MLSGSGGRSKDEVEHDSCSERLAHAVGRNVKVQFMIESIEKLGCKIPSNFFACRSCEGDISGGFVIDNAENKNAPYVPQILICQNKISKDESIDNTLIHELVHAYDKCRAKLKLTSCEQHACTEIRASNISGECDLWPEAKRGNFLKKPGECVRRRAALSVSMNPACNDCAKTVVDSVFQKCLLDVAPFNSENAVN